MAKKICIYLLAVLFIGSVAGVQATPMKNKKKPKKVHKWAFAKDTGKKDLKYFFKSKKEHRDSFKKLIKKIESKIPKGKNKDWKNDKIAKILGKTKLVKGQFKRGNDNSGMHAPEPATILLLGTGLIGLAGWRRKKLKR